MLCRILSCIYLSVHRSVFSYRLRRARRFPTHTVVSIGNLSAGGTGKTPLTIALAEELLGEEHSVLVCLRGYGGRDRSGILVADETGMKAGAEAAGDEAVLIGQRLLLSRAGHARFAVAAGPDRGGLIDAFGDACDVVLLDDAFQNPLVHRDVDLVLLDATLPPEAMGLLPCGRFREGLDALSRASTVILTRSDQASDLASRWEAAVRAERPGLAVRRSRLVVTGVVPVTSGHKSPRRGAAVNAFCGIGNPESFFRLIESSGYRRGEVRAFRDHHPFSEAELRQCGASGLPVLTTEKDAARLSSRHDLGGLFPGGLFFLRVDFRLEASGAGDSKSVLGLLEGDSTGLKKRKGFTKGRHARKRSERR